MKLLVAIDGSQYSLAAAASLAQFPLPLGQQPPLHIDLVSVMNPPEVMAHTQADLWVPQFVEHQQRMVDRALAAGREALAPLAATIKTHQTPGHVGHSLVDLADEFRSDLIVVGAKGHSLVERLLLGSVSDYVATHAHCSVLIVRPPQGVDGPGQPETGRVNWDRICVAVDQREVTSVVLDHLCGYRWTDAQSITVLTATASLDVFHEDFREAASRESEFRREDALQCAEAACQRLRRGDIRATAESIVTDHIGDGLVKAADERRADLIVLGETSRAALSRFLLGSTSRYVLRHAHCSVLIVRGAAH